MDRELIRLIVHEDCSLSYGIICDMVLTKTDPFAEQILKATYDN